MSLEQEGYRWRLDDDDEDEATWLANQDTNITRLRNINTRLRMLVNAAGNPDPAQYRLEYRKKGTSQWYIVNTGVESSLPSASASLSPSISPSISPSVSPSISPSASPSSEWLPTSMGGCALWLRSDLAWQDAAKTVPCTNESLIWTGEDKSGNGNDATQATEAKRFVYQDNRLDGFPGWTKDAVDDVMIVPHNSSLDMDGNFCVFLVAKLSLEGTYRVLTNKGTGNPYQYSTWVLDPTPGVGTGWMLVGNPYIGLTSNTGFINAGQYDYYQYECVWDGINTTGKFFRHGIAYGTPTAADVTENNPGDLGIGAYSDGGQQGAMTLIELVIINTTVSSDDVTNWNNYVKTRYPSLA